MKKLLLLLISAVLVSCGSKDNQPIVLQGAAFGTTYTIQAYPTATFDMQKGIDSVIGAVNISVNTYIPNSDISKINQGDSTIIVDAIFREVFEISAEVHEQSNGYFDPTVGVLRNAYGFGDTKPLQHMDSLTLDSLMQYVGFKKVHIKPDGTLHKDFPQIYFDFNAVAKGYGIDCLGRYLDKQGVTDYLIELGGEILSKGSNRQKNKPWVVGIEAIDSQLESRSYTQAIQLSNEALATSGNYRKFRIDTVTGRKFVHTINPLTGEAQESTMTSATVIANTCALADAYATTFMAMGLEKSKTLLETLEGVEVYFTYLDAQHQPQWYASEGMRRKFLE